MSFAINGFTPYVPDIEIYVFRLNQNDDGECVSLLKRGHTRLQIRFTEALPEAATVITYAKFPAIVHIDESRNVIT